MQREQVAFEATGLVEGALHGKGASLLVLGEPGLGKTALLEHVSTSIQTAARVVRACGRAGETTLPYALASQAIDSLGCGDALAPLWEPGPPHDSGSDLSPGGDTRGKIFHRLLLELQTASAERPILLVIDDLHWADRDSLSLLAFICRRIQSLRIAVVAAMRPWPPAAEETSLELQESGHAIVWRLAPLSDAASRELLARRLRRPIGDQVLARACALGSGNPGLLGHLAEAIEHGGKLTGPGDDGHSGPDPVLLGQLAGLPDASIRCVEAASVLGNPFRLESILAVAGMDATEADTGCRALVRSGMVAMLGDGRAECIQPLISQAVYDQLGPMRRAQLHDRAFRLLLAEGREAEAADHAHRARPRGDLTAVAVLERAGRGALRSGAVATSVRHLRAAVEYAGASVSVGLLTALGSALLANGQGGEAADVYERVLDREDGCPEVEAEARRMLARAHFVSGDAVLARLRFGEAVELAEAARPAIAVEAMLDQAHAQWATGGPVLALPLAAAARARAREVGDPRLQTRADAIWGLAAHVAGDPAGHEAARQASDDAPASAVSVLDLWWESGPLGNCACAAKLVERFDEAEEALAVMSAQAERSGSPHDLAALAISRTDLLVRTGRLHEAKGLALGQRSSFLRDAAPGIEALAHATQAAVLLHLDRAEEAEMACQRAERRATSRGQWLPLLRAWHVRALRLLRDGRPDLAVELYLRLESEFLRLGIREPCVVPWGRRGVLALLQCGQIDAARRVVAWLESCAAMLPCRWPLIAAHAGLAGLCEHEGDGVRAEAHLEAALELHRQVPRLSLERGETLLQLGALLRRLNRVGESRSALGKAQTIAEQCEAVELGRRAGAELALAGFRRREPGPRRGLTAAERRVAELARSGRSAAEIARQLSLSARTIETHLRRVYAKLGIHSQRELMTDTTLLGSRGAGPR